MSALTTCNCVLKIKDQNGNGVADAQLSYQPRRSQVHDSDSIYIGKKLNSQSQPGIEIQDLLYISKLETDITVAYTAGATAGAEVVTVTNHAISVQIQSGASTATMVKAAIDGSAAATALVYCIISGTAGDFQVTASATSLSEYYAYLPLSETTTEAQYGVFVLDYNDASYYGSVIFDPVMIPDQDYLDLSSLLTISRG